MHALVSLLDQTHSALVRQLWRELEKECGLAGVKVTPFPHFSWQVAADYGEPETTETLAAIAAQTPAFKVHTGGLGIFSGPEPVVYIAVRRSPRMDRLHAKLWRQFLPAATALSPFYHPRNWMPHITLIFNPETSAALSCGLKMLAFRPFDWELEVTNLSFVSQSDGQVGTLEYLHEMRGR